MMKEKIRELLFPLLLMYSGVILLYYPFMNRMDLPEYYFEIIIQGGFMLLIIGVFIIFYNKLEAKIANIVQSLRNKEETGIEKVVVSRKNDLKNVIIDIDTKKFIYKLNILLFNPSIDELVYIKDLILYRRKETKIKLIISSAEKNVSTTNFLKEILDNSNRFSDYRMEIRILDKLFPKSIIIYDTDAWIIESNNSDLMQSNVNYKVNIESRIGEEFVFLFNNLWDNSSSLEQ